MHDSVMEWVAKKVSHLDPRPLTALEVGSYDVNGSVRELFDVAEYVGVDVVDGPGVDTVVDPHQPLPFYASTFDVVVSTEMLEHAERPWFAVAEMARVARPGTPVLLTARGWRCTDERTGEVVCFGWHNPPDRWRFSGEAMEAMAAAAGLNVVEVLADPQVPGWFLYAVKPHLGP